MVNHPENSGKSARPQVVIVGAGFGGLSAARALAKADADITVIDRQNYHLFQPLLYQVATAALSPADIAWPIRAILRRQANTKVLLGEVTGVDPKRSVVLTESREIPYDFLVLATGATHAYFGHDDWPAHAPGLKSIDDATGIRRRILLAFEQAEIATDIEERKRLLTFVVIGGGPTGVEMAGTIAELARKALAVDFRNIDPRQARVILIEAGPNVLPAFPEKLSHYASRALSRLGVEVLTGHEVTACNSNGVTAKGETIPAATVIWAAGVAASPAARWLGVSADRAGRVTVTPSLNAPGHDTIFVIGDTAMVEDRDGGQLPGIAPVAKQQGTYVGRAIAACLQGRPAPGPFRYRDRGKLATIGRRAAVIEFGPIRLSGRVAWWLWGIAHIYFLISLRNRVIVAIQWLWSYLTFERGARLITGEDGSRNRADGPSVD